MDAGQLKERVEIQRQAAPVENNINGFEVPQWELYKKVWASKKNLYGKEYFAAKAVNEENTVDFIIRYSQDLEDLYKTEKFRIIWKDIIFNISYVDNIKQENKYLKLKCKQEPQQWEPQALS